MGQQLQQAKTIVWDGKEHFHLLPGRLRVSVPGLRYNQLMAEDLARRLSKLPGIKVGYVNPVSGRALIYYEEKRTDLKSLLEETLSQTTRSKIQKQQKIVDQKRTSIRRSSQAAFKKNNFPVSKQGRGKTHASSLSVQSAAQQLIPWHTMNRDKVLACLKTSLDQGLQESLVNQRLEKFGLNQLMDKPPTSILKLLIEPVKGFMSKLLLLAAGVSLIVGESSDALVIVVIVALQAVIEAFQGYRAEKSLAALKELSAPAANVLRDGQIKKIPASNLVPGDIIVLEAGDRVPADSRLLQVSNLTINESCLTGESLPVPKTTEVAQDHLLAIGDKENMVFSGTIVTSGRAWAAVVATGMQTEMGKIATLLKEVETEPTVLQKQMESLGKKITRIVGGAVGVIAIINLIQGRPLIEILRTGISLAVGAIPEGLPAVVTVSLAAGVQRMVKRNAVVRRLPAVETLGSTSVICTDKTGTLTKNEMTVKEIYSNGKNYQVTGEGYEPSGKLLYHGNPQEKLPPDLVTTLTVGVLCNNSELQTSENERWQIIGDPTEGALLTVAAKAGFWWKNLRQEHCRHKEIVFDSARKMMTVVCEAPDGTYHVYAKGAPDTLVKQCKSLIKNGSIVDLDEKAYKRIMAANNDMAGKALRVLATAWKTLPKDSDLESIDLENDLVFAGLVGMVDPPRPGVKEAIKKCQAAGVKVVMITGDHHKTAEAIAQKLGILQQGKSLTGDKLAVLSEEELIAEANNIVVYSRTSPDQKLRIVRALRKSGNIVAMTGDGVNDAPAVKEADIGVAMGLSGTDVTREAAGITLSDDNFATIVAGIEEGRTVGDNLAKSIRYVLSGSFGQVLAVFLAAVTGFPTPLVPPQILWINLVTESMPAMALTGDPPQKNCMNRPPVRPEAGFFANHGKEIIRKGILTGISTFGVYAGGLEIAGWVPMKARTMAFSHLVMGRVFNIFDSRRGRNADERPGAGNKFILPAAALSTAMLMLTMYVPFMRPFFSTVPIGLADWGLITVTSGLVGRIDSFLANSRSPGSRNIVRSKGYRFKKIHNVS